MLSWEAFSGAETHLKVDPAVRTIVLYLFYVAGKWLSLRSWLQARIIRSDCKPCSAAVVNHLDKACALWKVLFIELLRFRIAAPAG